MRGAHFVLQIVRAAFSWAGDSERGNLLPSEFRNPFISHAGLLRRPSPDPTRELPITTEMVVEFVGVCDHYQQQLFLPLVLFGLRASEPVWLFHEDLQRGWLDVRCNPELDYLTKGQRDKRFPLIESLTELWENWTHASNTGLLLRRREWDGNLATDPQSYGDLVTSYHNECRRRGTASLLERRQIRDTLMQTAGGLNYDQIDGEFRRLARQLSWKPNATLKGFRHLFATALENSGCPETYRRFFLGHSPGRAASLSYTHLDQLGRHFRHFLDGEYAGIVAAFQKLIRPLQQPNSQSDSKSQLYRVSSAS